jgi:hypothetical protein
MTISNTSIKNVYSGNGVATVFAFTFPIAAETELEVYLLESGFLTLKTLTTDYTIAGVGNPSGGSVTFVTPPPTVAGGSDIVLVRRTPLTQLADYIEGDSFPAETHEAALDKLTKIAQEHSEALSRAAQLPINSSEDLETLTQAILLVADNSTNINTVAADIADINTVATDISNVNIVATNIANVNAVAANETNINAVAANETNINAVAANEANINAVAANETNINAAVADLPALSAKVSKTGDAMSGLLQLDQSSDIVAAATTDLGTATGNAVTVTHASGALAITSFGGASLQSGTELTITWSVSGGSLSVTHNATSLILPSAANLTIADGDVWKIQKVSDSLAYWRVVNVSKADGTALVAPIPNSPVRQTILSGPVDTNGLPSFGGSTGSTTVTASGTLIATAANGFDANGAVNRIGSIINPSWTGLSTDGTMYLYLDIAADGTCSTGAGTLAPNYRWGGADVTTNGQFTFNIQEMQGKVGNGSAAVQRYRVYVGEVTVSGSVVTAITWYALQGRYELSGVALPGATTTTSANHNLGVMPKRYDVVIVCASANNGYAVGDEARIVENASGSNYFSPIRINRLAMSTVTAATNLIALNISTGASVNLTRSNFTYTFRAERGW